MTTIRASKLDQFLECPGSQGEPAGYELRTSNMLARLGSAVHEPLSIRIAGGDTDNLKNYAVKWDVPLKQLEKLFFDGLRLFGEVREFFTSDLQTEVYHEIQPGDVKLTGHKDVIGYNHAYRMAVVADHKTGFVDGLHLAQVKTYGMMALDLFPQAEKVLTILLGVRAYTRDQEVYTRKELNDWYHHRVNPLHNNRALNTNPLCRFCNLRGQCPAYAELVKQSAQIVLGNHEEVKPRALYDSIKHLEKLIKAARQYLVDQAHDNGHTLEYDDIYHLILESKAKQKILFGQALPILSQHLDSREIADLASISKGKLKQAIMDKHPTGQKGKAFDGVINELMAAGALQDIIYEQLVKRKKGSSLALETDEEGYDDE